MSSNSIAHNCNISSFHINRQHPPLLWVNGIICAFGATSWMLANKRVRPKYEDSLGKHCLPAVGAVEPVLHCCRTATIQDRIRLVPLLLVSLTSSPLACAVETLNNKTTRHSFFPYDITLWNSWPASYKYTYTSSAYCQRCTRAVNEQKQIPCVLTINLILIF